MSRFVVWQESFARLSRRERGMVLAASCGLLTWLLVWFGLAPQQQLYQRQLQQLQANQQQLQQLTAQLQLVQQQMQQDVNQQIRLDIAEREAQQQQLVDQIRQLTGRYVSPEQMTQLLADVLGRHSQVQLISMRSNTPIRLQLPGSATSDFPLYRHGTVLEFRGSYAQLHDLLARLEQLPWQLHWRQLQYKVADYPQAIMQLELETVSEQADYLRI